MKKIFLYTVFISIILFSFLISIYKTEIGEKKEFEKKIAVNIKIGTSLKRVTSILKEKNILKYKWPFLLYLKIHNLEKNIQAGDYIFNYPIGIKDLVVKMQNSKQEERRIIIPEGFSVYDIDESLTNKKLIKKGDFIKCAKECVFPEFDFFSDGNIEGYLFPDTYFASINNFSSKKFMKRKLTNFKNKVLTEKFIADYKRHGNTLNKIVIMASIIEREENNVKNMPIISGILWKRIKIGMNLGVDATTRYYKKSKTGALTYLDFQQDNAYNTRKRFGLTPTAISNPGLDALKASLYPRRSGWLYYLHDFEGKIRYASSNRGHVANKNRYLK